MLKKQQKSMQRTSQFKAQCKSRLWNSKNHCVWSHGMQNSRCALTKRAVVLNICTLNFISYFYFMQIFMPLCMTQNCGLHYSNYVSSTFKMG